MCENATLIEVAPREPAALENVIGTLATYRLQLLAQWRKTIATLHK